MVPVASGVAVLALGAAGAAGAPGKAAPALTGGVASGVFSAGETACGAVSAAMPHPCAYQNDYREQWNWPGTPRRDDSHDGSNGKGGKGKLAVSGRNISIFIIIVPFLCPCQRQRLAVTGLFRLLSSADILTPAATFCSGEKTACASISTIFLSQFTRNFTMPNRNWTLVDHERDIYVDHIALGPEHLGGAAQGGRIEKRTLGSGLSRGVDVIECWPRRFPLRRVAYPRDGYMAGEPGPTVPSAGNRPFAGRSIPPYVRRANRTGWAGSTALTSCRSAAAWRERRLGILPDGRLRYGLHGKIANLPAHKVEVTVDEDSGRIAVRGTVEEARLFGGKLRLETSDRDRGGPAGDSRPRHGDQLVGGGRRFRGRSTTSISARRFCSRARRWRCP